MTRDEIVALADSEMSKLGPYKRIKIEDKDNRDAITLLYSFHDPLPSGEMDAVGLSISGLEIEQNENLIEIIGPKAANADRVYRRAHASAMEEVST